MVNLMRDRAFQTANHVFIGQLRKLREEGLDVSKQKDAVDPSDLRKMYESGVLSDKDPLSLQRKVYVEVSLHFARRGREGLRELKKQSFRIAKDVSGQEFVVPNFNEKEKNHQGSDSKRPFEKSAVMYSVQNEANCPVKSFKLYLSKLHPNSDIFFQLPNKDYAKDGMWYKPRPVGKNTLGDMLKKISLEANLTNKYTNHCLRATAATALHSQGVKAADIKYVTGHRNVQSLEHYIESPNLQKKKEMSHMLQAYHTTGASSSSEAAQTEASQASHSATHAASGQGDTAENEPEMSPDENKSAEMVSVREFLRSESPVEAIPVHQAEIASIPSKPSGKATAQASMSQVLSGVTFTGNCVINITVNN